MDRPTSSDAVAALNARAAAMGWGVHCDRELHFAQPELNALAEVWRAKAERVGWPSRRDFEARDVKAFLPHVWFAECLQDASGRLRYRNRLFGSELVHTFGEQTGRHLDELLPAPQLERWTTIYETVLSSSQPLRVVSRFDWHEVSWLDGESFLAPLSNSGAPPRMILGAMYMTSKQELRVAG